MKKTLIILWLIVVIFVVSYPGEAIGGGVIAWPGEVETPEGASWGYEPNLSPKIGVTYKFNDELAVFLGVMATRLNPQDYYETANGKKIEILDGRLSYQHLNLTGRYSFRPNRMLNPYLEAGGGIYSWDAEIEVNQFNVEEKPRVIDLDRKINSGLSLGGGLEVEIKDNFLIATNGNYHYLVSDYQQGGVAELVVDFKIGF